MKKYEWRRLKSHTPEGYKVYETRDTTQKEIPPDDRPGWERVFSFGVREHVDVATTS